MPLPACLGLLLLPGPLGLLYTQYHDVLLPQLQNTILNQKAWCLQLCLPCSRLSWLSQILEFHENLKLCSSSSSCGDWSEDPPTEHGLDWDGLYNSVTHCDLLRCAFFSFWSNVLWFLESILRAGNLLVTLAPSFFHLCGHKQGWYIDSFCFQKGYYSCVEIFFILQLY